MIKSIQFFAAFCLLFVSTALFSQTDNGKLSFSVGVGVTPTFLADNATVNTPPLNARLTYQFTPSFQLSGFVGYSSSTTATPLLVSDGQLSLTNNKQTLFGLRGEMRKEINEKFDFYGGALLGYNHTNKREFDMNSGDTIIRDSEGPTSFNPNAKKGQFLYSAFVGSTFYFTKNVGLFAEIGYGVSILNTGFTVRI